MFFRNPEQFIILPTIGFVRDAGCIWLNVSWLNYGFVIRLFNFEE